MAFCEAGHVALGVAGAHKVLEEKPEDPATGVFG